jgi:hypothetical protein
MLARRGLRPSLARPDLPFSSDISAETADALAERLGHYAFRLFVRGVILHGDGFTPDEPTSYVSAAQARLFTETLVALGVVAANGRDRYRLVRRAGSFGGTLEWYVGRELRRWLGFDVATGVKFHARGIGGDLDLVAAAEGKLIYVELKSSPPKHLSNGEVGAFLRSRAPGEARPGPVCRRHGAASLRQAAARLGQEPGCEVNSAVQTL